MHKSLGFRRRAYLLTELELLLRHYDPTTVMKLAGVLNSVCRTAECSFRESIGAELREQLARRILAAYDAGVKDWSILESDALTCVARPRNECR